MRMRTIVSVVAALSLAACLNSTHPAAATAQTRHDIARAMKADTSGDSSRKIVELRDVTGDSATVVTEQAGAGQREERWVRGSDGWKQDTSTGPVAQP